MIGDSAAWLGVNQTLVLHHSSGTGGRTATFFSREMYVYLR
jgi:hypothetical protein